MNLRIGLVLILISLISLFSIYNLKRQEKIISPLSTKIYKIPSPTKSPSPTPTIIPIAIPTIEPTLTPTAVPAPLPPTLPPISMEELFEKYASQYAVSKDLLKRIAICESGLNPNAVNLGYGGLFQFAESSWISTRNLMNLDPNTSLRFNAEESIKTAAFLISRGNSNLIWPSCGK